MQRKMLSLVMVALLVLVAAVGCRPATPQPQDPQPPQQTPAPDPNQGPAAFEDGTREAEGEPDERGWKPTISVTVENGLITEVNYEELDNEGNPKSENDEYNQRWQAQAGISAPGAFEAYENQLIERQNVEEVEVVTGATSTYEKFRTLAQQALEGNQ